MMKAMPSIAWPVWLRVVSAMETTSWKPMATASELFLVRFRYWLVIGGMMTRIDCGRMIWRRTAPGLQAESGGGLPLALRDGLDAGADDLGDVGGGVDRETEQEGEELGAEVPPPWKLKPLQDREFDGEGGAEDGPDDDGQADQQGEGDGPDGGADAGGVLLAVGAAVPEHGADQADDEGHQRGGVGRLPVDFGQSHASVGEEGDAAEVQGLFRGGQTLRK